MKKYQNEQQDKNELFTCPNFHFYQKILQTRSIPPLIIHQPL